MMKEEEDGEQGRLPAGLAPLGRRRATSRRQPQKLGGCNDDVLSASAGYAASPFEDYSSSAIRRLAAALRLVSTISTAT